MSSGHQRIKWRRNIAENFNWLSRVHERYKRTTDRRQMDGRRHIANMNMSSRSLIKLNKKNSEAERNAKNRKPRSQSGWYVTIWRRTRVRNEAFIVQ